MITNYQSNPSLPYGKRSNPPGLTKEQEDVVGVEMIHKVEQVEGLWVEVARNSPLEVSCLGEDNDVSYLPTSP